MLAPVSHKMHLRFEAISACAGGYNLILKYIFLAGFSAKILCFLGTVWRFSVLIRIVLLIDSRICCTGIVCLSQDLHMNFKMASSGHNSAFYYVVAKTDYISQVYFLYMLG